MMPSGSLQEVAMRKWLFAGFFATIVSSPAAA
jgi:hypothetical protein